MDRDRDLHFILLVIMANLLILQTEFIAIHMSFIIFQLILCLSQSSFQTHYYSRTKNLNL